MTMPLSLTSSRYAAAAARRSLERTSVVSIITSCPIHASGILSSESAALGFSLSIIVCSSNRSCRKCRIPLPKGPLSPRQTGKVRSIDFGELRVDGVLRIHLLRGWVNRVASDVPRAEHKCVIQHTVLYDTDSPDDP